MDVEQRRPVDAKVVVSECAFYCVSVAEGQSRAYQIKFSSDEGIGLGPLGAWRATAAWSAEPSSFASRRLGATSAWTGSTPKFRGGRKQNERRTTV